MSTLDERVQRLRERMLHQCDFCWRVDPDDLRYKYGRIDGGKAGIIQMCSHCVIDDLVWKRITPLTRREVRKFRKAVSR